MQVTDTRLRDYINLAQEELIFEGDWPGVVDRWRFVATSGYIVLPWFLDRIMNLTIDGIPAETKSAWYEMVAYGPGQLDRLADLGVTWCCANDGMIVDRGSVVTQVALPLDGGPWWLRVYGGTAADCGTEQPYLTAQGTNDDDESIRTQITTGSCADDWIDGERIPISDGTSYYQSENQYKTITGIIKPRTSGYVRLTAWNGTDELTLSSYAPNETVPMYRQYFSPWLWRRQTDDPCIKVILARCRRKYTPLFNDDDIAIIGNVPAMKAMVQAIWKRDANKWDDYQALKQTSIDLLRKEASSYNGPSRVPSFTFQRGFPIGAIPYVR